MIYHGIIFIQNKKITQKSNRDCFKQKKEKTKMDAHIQYGLHRAGDQCRPHNFYHHLFQNIYIVISYFVLSLTKTMPDW